MKSKFSNISSNLFDLLVILERKIFNPLLLSKAINLTPAQFSILFYLMKHGNSSVSEAADYLQISKPNMTPLLDSLIELGYVQRERDTQDRRVVRLNLTESGLHFYDEMKKTNMGFVEEIFKDYSLEELEALLDSSQKLLDAIIPVSGMDKADYMDYAEENLTGKTSEKLEK